jgi:lysozyme family protein
VRSLHDERLNFLHGLSTWDHFGRGWGRRVEEVTTLSISMAAGNVMAIPHHTFAPAPFRAIDPVRSRRVRAIQSDLAVKGLYRGALDGDDGFQTLLAFQRAESDIKGDVVQRVTIENFDKALAA